MEARKNPSPKSKKPFYKTFVGSILSMIGILVAMYFVVIFSLGFITDHGNEKVVPKLVGLNKEQAIDLLNQEGYDIVVDSTYDPSKAPFEVIDQQPIVGRHVKPGRSIFITINKGSAPESPMPNLINLSLRSATLVLKSSKLLLGDTIIRPDFSKGAVLEQLINGEKIQIGALIPQGTKIDLVIGGGMSVGFVNVPNVKSINFDMAKSVLTSAGVYFDIVYDGVISDTVSAVVVDQYPEAYNEEGAPNKMAQGESVRLTIAQTPRTTITD